MNEGLIPWIWAIFAALPISWVAVPYLLLRKDTRLRLFARPLSIIAIAWIFIIILPTLGTLLIGLAIIAWQAVIVKQAIERTEL